jgi:hypothetical protein
VRVRGYSRSSGRTPSAPANRRAVLGLAMRRSSSKSEMESADTPLLAESSRGSIPRSSRTRLSRCSRGMGDLYPAIGRGEREPSGRANDLGRPAPETGAGSRGVGLTNHSGHDEHEAIHEEEQRMSYTATAWQNVGPPRINATDHLGVYRPAPAPPPTPSPRRRSTTGRPRAATGRRFARNRTGPGTPGPPGAASRRSPCRRRTARLRRSGRRPRTRRTGTRRGPSP